MPLEALGWELAWLEGEDPAEAGALPADWEAAVPLDAAVTEVARLVEPATVEVDPEGGAAGTDTGDDGTDDPGTEPVVPWELEPALAALEAEGKLDAEPDAGEAVESEVGAVLLESDAGGAGTADAGAGLDGTGAGLFASGALDPEVEL